ncbi:uncharacterized protein LOC134192870 [Corticium candelabrum]|uniref:uncharacterized protein LOC134192870 n=1 Tax=Corticium candelabrum TaxID=121492 RepID=UPI002E256B78|nr:uncharacterized protein LOC134192870 [Corticium candelabrum]
MGTGHDKTRDLSITFTAPSGTSTTRFHHSLFTRISIVKLVCKDKLPLSDSTLTFEKEDPADTYNLILTSKCCCPDLCQTKPEPSSSSGHGLSIGSILLIVFFSLIFVYILCGILYLKFVRGASGVELIPNYSFWALLPSLIKEGVVFLIGKCRGQDTSSTQYEKI